MARAQNLSDVVSIESELSRREGDLESLQGQKRMLDDQTALSTITVVLLSPQATVPSKPTRPQKGFLAGLKAGWRAFTGSLSVLLTVVGALLPWLLLVGVPAAAVLVYLRRRRALPPAAEPAAQLAAEVPPAAG